MVRKGFDIVKEKLDIKSLASQSVMSQMSRTTYKDDGTKSSNKSFTFSKVEKEKLKEDLHEVLAILEQEVEEEA